MSKPSFITSTLAMLTFVCVIATLATIFVKVEISDFVQGVITSVLGAYFGSRLPNTRPEKSVEVIDETPISGRE